MILRVLCFEKATMRQPNVKDEWVMRIERDVRDATAHHSRTDGPRL